MTAIAVSPPVRNNPAASASCKSCGTASLRVRFVHSAKASVDKPIAVHRQRNLHSPAGSRRRNDDIRTALQERRRLSNLFPYAAGLMSLRHVDANDRHALARQ